MIKLLEWKGITQSRNKNVQKPVANICLIAILAFST